MTARKSKPLSVSTKTGDQGQTSLANGQRLPKSDIIFEVIGTVDELNSWLGLIAAKFENEFEKHKEFLYEVQDTLFYVGAELAGAKKVKLSEVMLEKLEKQADQLQTQMAGDWHSKFLLPGGTELGAYLDISRTVARRTERLIVVLSERDEVRPLVLKYINRLSDYLYVLRCHVNHAVEYQEQQFDRK